MCFPLPYKKPGGGQRAPWPLPLPFPVPSLGSTLCKRLQGLRMVAATFKASGGGGEGRTPHL